MRHSVLAGVGAIGLSALTSGCSDSTDAPDAGPRNVIPAGTLTDNVLVTESLEIELLDVELADGSVAVIDYEVTNTSEWDSTLEDSWLTHVGVRQHTPSTGTETLVPIGFDPEASPEADDSPVLAPGETTAGTISYRLVDPAVELVVTTFDDDYGYVGESTFNLR